MEPACRIAWRARVQCPKCHRELSAKTLKFTHRCPADPDALAEEARLDALRTFTARMEAGMGSCQQRYERKQRLEPQPAKPDKDYSQLFASLRRG